MANNDDSKKQKQQRQHPGAARSFLFGGSMFVLSTTAQAPLDRVKILYQCQGEMVRTGRLPEPYRGLIDCTVRTFRTEGFLPFWRGNLVSLMQFPNHTLSFAFKEALKPLFKPSASDSHAKILAKNIVSGAVAGFLTLCFSYPLDYARTRLANDVKASRTSERQFRGIIDVYRKTWTSDGLIGVYRGFVVSCVGIIVYRGSYFGLYDTLKPIILGDGSYNLLANYFLGFGVTLTAGLISYPLDTIRRRMLMRSCEQVKYRGSYDCFLQVVRKEGPLALMNGVSINIIRGIAGAAMLAGYDRLKKFYFERHV